jgi:nitrate reductase NapE component
VSNPNIILCYDLAVHLWPVLRIGFVSQSGICCEM